MKRLIILLIGGGLMMSGSFARAEELLVFAAASLTDVLKEIRVLYERHEPTRIVYNFDASSTLSRQISEGAPADVFVSADEAKMDGLEKMGLVVSTTRKSILSNSLVIVTFRESTLDIDVPEKLSDPRIHRLALADPAAVPAGVYAKAYLQSKELWSSVADRVVPLANVRSVLAAVEAGNAEVGFVYKTDAKISKNVRIAYEIPPDEAPSITYPVAVIAASKQMVAAEQFVKFLQSGEVSDIFRRYGFDPLPAK